MDASLSRKKIYKPFKYSAPAVAYESKKIYPQL